MKLLARRMWCVALVTVCVLFASTGTPAVFAMLALPSVVSCLRLSFWYRSSDDETKVMVSDDDVISVQFDAGDDEEVDVEVDTSRLTPQARTHISPARKRRFLFILGHAIIIVGSLPLVLVQPMAFVPLSTVVSFACIAFAPAVFLYASEIQAP
jgi:hypothetical protein